MHNYIYMGKMCTYTCMYIYIYTYIHTHIKEYTGYMCAYACDAKNKTRLLHCRGPAHGESMSFTCSGCCTTGVFPMKEHMNYQLWCSLLLASCGFLSEMRDSFHRTLHLAISCPCDSTINTWTHETHLFFDDLE